MSKNSELKACPFCGGAPKTKYKGVDTMISCTQCWCEMTKYYDPHKLRVDAVEDAWNARTSEDEIAKLKEMLNEAASHLTCEYEEYEDFELAYKLREAAK